MHKAWDGARPGHRARSSGGSAGEDPAAADPATGGQGPRDSARYNVGGEMGTGA